MAEVFSSNDVAEPSTPTKNGLNDSAPSYPTPAPEYTQSESNPLFEAQKRPVKPPRIGKPDYEVRIPELGLPNGGVQLPNHPVYPGGDIFYDIKNHLRCYSLFNANVEALLSQYSSMKIEWEKASVTISKLTRELNTERSMKESYYRQCEVLKTSLRQSQDDLLDVRRELVDTQNKLASSISQLAEIARRLEIARGELRTVTRERDELILKITDKDEEIKFLEARISELNISLELAVGAEREANDRNSRLTELLLQIERVKVTIERERDTIRIEVIQLRERVKELETDFGRITREGRIHDLETLHVKLDFEIVTLKDKLRNTELQFGKRETSLKEQLSKSAKFEAYFGDLWERISDYNSIVQELPIEHRSKFPKMIKRKMLDGTDFPEFKFGEVKILTQGAQEGVTEVEKANAESATAESTTGESTTAAATEEEAVAETEGETSTAPAN